MLFRTNLHPFRMSRALCHSARWSSSTGARRAQAAPKPIDDSTSALNCQYSPMGIHRLLIDFLVFRQDASLLPTPASPRQPPSSSSIS